MKLVVISVALVFLGLGQSFSSSGTFYQKVTDSGDKAHVPTKAFHQCSIKNDCNYVGIPITNAKKGGDADSDVYSAATMQELQVIDSNMKIWRKIKLDNDEHEDLTSCAGAILAGGLIEKSLSSFETKGVDTFCDRITDDGWIVFQRRLNDSVSFKRDWQNYTNGFGDLDGSFWLGLELLHDLTSVGNWTLRVDLNASGGKSGYAEYTNFKIGNEDAGYKLMFDKFSGNIEDALKSNYGKRFSTCDKHQSAGSGWLERGGWWYNSYQGCKANLNSLHPYTSQNLDETSTGINCVMSWTARNHDFGKIIFSEMKMKRED